jgi:uncharacterized protein
VIAVIALAVLLGSFVQAVVGLGVGLVTAPVIAVLEPSLMPTLPLLFGLLVSGLSLAGERHHVDWPAIGWSLPGRIPGTLLGIGLVLAFTSAQLGVAVAIMVLVAVLLSVRSLSVPVNRATLLAAGFTSGVTGTATSIGGPPIALLFQHRRPSEVRATLAVFFFIGVVLSLTGLAITGSIPLDSVVVAALVSPLLLLGIWVGTRVRDRLRRDRFRVAVLAVCAASAVVLLVRSLV